MNKILCYGDSLTAGYSEWGTNFTPYGDTLEIKSKLEVTSVGMSGWTTFQMVNCANKSENYDVVDRKADGLQLLLSSGRYDLLCLMAGTNDLGTGVPEDEIIRNLAALIKIVLSTSSNIKVALLTVPATGSELHYESVRTRRANVNQGILKLSRRYEDRVFLIDASAALPNPGEHPKPPTEESQLWDMDLLHLSPTGSAKLGEFVFESLSSMGYLPMEQQPNVV